MIDYSLGCRMPADDWANLNRIGVFDDPALSCYVGPFPPLDLMYNTTGVDRQSDFAAHGADFWIALSRASPKALCDFSSVLDFGCGCGRLARMFKGHPGYVAGCDIDHRHVDWCAEAIDHFDAKLSRVKPPIPFGTNEFEAVISISIFSHLNEAGQDEFLQELARVCKPEGLLFLTVHGKRAMTRALTEPKIRNLLDMPDELFEQAREKFERDELAFVLQQGHLTTVVDGVAIKGKVISDPFEYGITFMSESYVRAHWSQWFEIVEIRPGGIHDFQDIVVLRPRK
ncbi:class I SAM-dependent methyltransferase [Rhodanobacter denitrificans]|uniref:class I SAM-dependent methyltransferase n=1 Tax=Rhodanobacter denitrificans TaxID=666685 RepID=UPI001218E058|nr:class I SAM-dependent methyltransferase [Rhodanobacter denitrificans]TAM60800.1 MAG: class I SAM-dependent methyltransferase [Rhodanobacter sp.]UJJ59571.1 class I SAM-dependent methyltransferase [Rhodanobacter denitrificans]